MITASSIFTAIVAAIKAIPIVDSWFQQLIAAWMNGQTNETLAGISDAAAFASRATTDELRYQASAKWIAALQRSRITS